MVCPKCYAENAGTRCYHCGHDVADDFKQADAARPVVIINNVAPPRRGYISPKSKWVAFFLCFLLGAIGAHRFYVGKIGTGVLFFFTLGFWGIGWVIDLFTILFGNFKDSTGLPLSA